MSKSCLPSPPGEGFRLFMSIEKSGISILMSLSYLLTWMKSTGWGTVSNIPSLLEMRRPSFRWCHMFSYAAHCPPLPSFCEIRQTTFAALFSWKLTWGMWRWCLLQAYKIFPTRFPPSFGFLKCTRCIYFLDLEESKKGLYMSVENRSIWIISYFEFELF